MNKGPRPPDFHLMTEIIDHAGTPAQKGRLVRLGNAWLNETGTISVHLDTIPLSGVPSQFILVAAEKR